jgi:hypothetical protein
MRRGSQSSKGLKGSVGLKHQRRLHIRFLAGTRRDAAQTKQRSIKLGDRHNSDELGGAQQCASRGKIKFGEAIERIHTSVQRSISDRAERGQ